MNQLIDGIQSVKGLGGKDLAKKGWWVVISSGRRGEKPAWYGCPQEVFTVEFRGQQGV